MDALSIVVQTRVPGGTWTLYGRPGRDGWHFHTDLNESYSVTPVLGKPVHELSGEMMSWPEALDVYDRHPWFRYDPVHVHDEFRDAIWQAFQERQRRYGAPDAAREHWREECVASAD